MADSARAIIENTLREYGLGTLAPKLWQDFLSGKPVEQIFIDMRSTDEYKARFPAMSALAAKGRALTEDQYIEYERNAAEVFRAAGLPSGFYDQPEDFGGFIANDVSLNELQSRVQMASAATYSWPTEFQEAAESLYGLDRGTLTAFMLDPDRAAPLIQQRYAAIQSAGIARQTGYGNLTTAEAESLAVQGVSAEEAEQGFNELARSRSLFTGLTGTTETDLDRSTQLSAAFSGDADAQERIRRRQQRRAGAFAGGGSFASTNQGFTGLGQSQ